MPKLNYIHVPVSKRDTDTISKEEVNKKIQRLEVASAKARNEMDFSKICEADDLPPDPEPVD